LSANEQSRSLKSNKINYFGNKKLKLSKERFSLEQKNQPVKKLKPDKNNKNKMKKEEKTQDKRKK
jgi:hypothetical protein